MSPLAEGSSPEEEPVAPASQTPEVSAPEEDKRRYPSTIGGAFYLVILGVTIAGLVVVGTGHWRTGLHCVAGSLVVGAALRSVLPQRDAGMLAVRARWIDVTVMGAMGVLLWVLASTTPNT